MNHAHQVEVHEAAILAAILAVEKAGTTVVNDAKDVAGGLQKAAQDAGKFATDGAKKTLVNMNPLTSLRHVR